MAHEMELGNFIFGHSRGEFPIPDRMEYSGYLKPLFEALNPFGNYYNYGMDFENDVFEMHPYCWCDSEKCAQCGSTGEEANLLFKPTGFKLNWYKYAMRDAYTNQEVNPQMFQDIVAQCIESLKEKTDGTG